MYILFLRVYQEATLRTLVTDFWLVNCKKMKLSRLSQSMIVKLWIAVYNQEK